MSEETIACRVRRSEACQDGKPSSSVYGEGTGMDEDGTWDGETVVCDPCYIAIGMPTCNSNPGSVGGGKGTPGSAGRARSEAADRELDRVEGEGRR